VGEAGKEIEESIIMPQENAKKSSPALIALAWLIVIAPTAWGLTFTVQNALKIFTAAPK
jgi:hypothetical protein